MSPYFFQPALTPSIMFMANIPHADTWKLREGSKSVNIMPLLCAPTQTDMCQQEGPLMINDMQSSIVGLVNM